MGYGRRVCHCDFSFNYKARGISRYEYSQWSCGFFFGGDTGFSFIVIFDKGLFYAEDHNWLD